MQHFSSAQESLGGVSNNTPKCEFCGALLPMSSEDTVCRPCDSRLAAEQQAHAEARATAWGASHKCKECASPLPEARYSICFTCAPEDTRPSEDVDDALLPDLEGVEDEGVIMERLAEKLARREMETPEFFVCSTCRETKRGEECQPRWKRGRPYFTRCKDCNRAAKNASSAAYRERLAAAKAAKGVA